MKKDEDIKPQAQTSTSEGSLDNQVQEKREDSAPSAQASAGAILKKAREGRGLTIQQVATQLKLKVDIVEHLENDSLDDNLHTPTFVRGYLCSYAKLMDIPVDDVSAIYDLNHDAKQSYEVHMQTFSQETKIRTSDNRINVVTWVLAICLIVLSGIWWWQNREETVLTDMQTVEAAEESATSDLSQALTVMSDENEGEVAIVIEQTPVEEAPAKVQSKAPVVKESVTKKEPKVQASAPEKTEQAVVAQQAAAVQTHSGHVVFNGDCWINVRGADGKSLINGVRKAGTTADFSGVAPFKVVLGAPSNVELTYEGKVVDLSVFSKKGKVARLTLGE